jgi:hypothetical protein
VASRDPIDWSRVEVEAIVASYLQMLTMELAGQAYSKAQQRRQLAAKLNNRSSGSIEFKHCNLSAVMIDLGFPYVRGYQPRSNYQSLLLEIAAEQIALNPLLDEVALASVQKPAAPTPQLDFTALKVEPPPRQETAATPLAPTFRASKRDYLEREAQNRSLGAAGEGFALQYEQWRLAASGRQYLAERVQHVSKTQGDGLGFDILSFNLDGTERFIEVKTTAFGRDTPFFVTATELSRSKVERDNYHLYRLYEFRQQPRFFGLTGALDAKCFLEPQTYKARFS